ncbi:MAG TPA: tetratricopeptide repeat-containing diguanylate cyclase [Casimicrobiaceae bacterium]|nr:tetratricopeptide repeat-containing diguanylate cyclase [Casimicrobiaceae bacterium]
MTQPPARDAVDLWERHFRDPAATAAQAQALLAQDASQSAVVRGWWALTVAFHHLFFTGTPAHARSFLSDAQRAFAEAGDRRGELLAGIGNARLAIVERAAASAREQLLALYPEARQALPPQDRFWLLNALGAAYYFTDRLDEAIRYLYEALESLRSVERSPQHPAVMSNLAAALVTVGDYAPAREVAEGALAELEHFDNPQLVLFARSNLAEALTGLDDHRRALDLVDAMLDDAAAKNLRTSQNHYLSIAAELYARHGRIDDAVRCADLARAILADFPVGFNEAHARWADAVVADARRDDDAVSRLSIAAEVAAARGYLPGECKAWARLAERHAEARDFEAAYTSARKLLAAETQRLSHRASAKYYLLRVEHALAHARDERDRALAQQREMQRLNEELARVNADLSHKMIQVEALQAQLAVEAVRDPLTQLFNRRYLDSVTPGLITSAERRNARLSLALLDLDHFKLVNDRHGHPAGDVVLREIGRVLPMSLRPADIVCRYGGEEFCVVLPDADSDGAERALASLAARLSDLRVSWNGSTLGGFTFSAGIAALGHKGTTLGDLLAAADRALYEAKDAGRNRIHVAAR